MRTSDNKVRLLGRIIEKYTFCHKSQNRKNSRTNLGKHFVENTSKALAKKQHYYIVYSTLTESPRWNESEYGNVKDLRFPPNVIWTPDILMYNR